MIYAGGALFLAAAGGVVFFNCSRGLAASGAVPAVVTAEIAAGAAGAAGGATMRATVATSPWVAGAAAQGVSAADVLVDYGHDHRRGARLSACLADLVHELHLQSRFGRRLHGRRLTRGTGRSFADPTGTSPRESAHVPGLSIRNHLSSHTYKSRSGRVGSSCLI